MCWDREFGAEEKKETKPIEGGKREMTGHSKLRGQQLKITPATFEQPWANDNRSKLKLRQTRSHGTSKAAINCYGTTASNSDKFAGITFFDKRKPSVGREGKRLKYAPVSRYRGARVFPIKTTLSFESGTTGERSEVIPRSAPFVTR